jgi:hypothetical protein
VGEGVGVGVGEELGVGVGVGLGDADGVGLGLALGLGELDGSELTTATNVTCSELFRLGCEAFSDGVSQDVGDSHS